MPRKNGEGSAPRARANDQKTRLHPETRRSIWGVASACLAVLFTLAYFEKAGPAGVFIRNAFDALFGWGYFVLPLSLLVLAGAFLVSERRFIGFAFFGAFLFMLAVLGLIDTISPGHGGWLGFVLGSLRFAFGRFAAFIVNVGVAVIAVLIAMNAPLKIRWRRERAGSPAAEPPLAQRPETPLPAAEESEENPPKEKETLEAGAPRVAFPLLSRARRAAAPPKFGDYVPPPAGLLASSIEKPTTGDLRANANIIKRTLESFGIPVEMGEINIGPKVTRYTLKPAEGMKISRITALNQDLALALAAHPIRIEAPIPGKSLVGIEVPNRTAALVRLGSLMTYPDFQSSGSLGFALGRDVTGEPIFPDIARMPHLLIAGSTGSGKSIVIHSLLTSLLYKNSPATLRLILVDPKRVELSCYEGLPHLTGPVITESKKAVGVFRWAIAEMERRYDLLQGAGSRDLKSYNTNGGKDNPLPYLLIVVDELADLMTTYGREVEGSVVRLAQMSRATGIHLILSTQRPSVEVITGLIKANITSRIALQVASQVDSRTILDAAGAEKLLGGGDLLFISSELSKPRRAQGAYLTEEEIAKVTDFVREHNPATPAETGTFEETAEREGGGWSDEYGGESDDEMLDDAVRLIAQAQKASASLLQRRLKVGYARAARLLDLMEDRGFIGPGEGAKPREVYLDEIKRFEES